MIFVFRLISTVYTVYENHVIFFLYNSLSEHFSFGSRDHYHTTAGVKLFISRKSNVTFNKKKKEVFYRVSADGSCSIKWNWKDINVRASLPHTVGGGCRWLPGSYVERAVDLEDRLDVQLLSLSWTMSSAQEHWIPPHNWHEHTEKIVLHKNKLEKKCLAQWYFDSWWQREYFFHYIFTQRAQAGHKTDYLTFTRVSTH